MKGIKYKINNYYWDFIGVWAAILTICLFIHLVLGMMLYEVI